MIRVIGAGFGRTGTESLRAALEVLLEGPCYHMREVIGRPDHVDRWDAFARSGRTGMDWPALLNDFVAAVDWPICNYYAELKEAFPEAKVILTVRDSDRWFDSFQQLVRLGRATAVLGLAVPRLRRFRRMVDGAALHIFDSPTDRKRCIAVYERHLAEVKAQVPPEDLLVFEVGQGWAPLCAFLDKPLPGDPFPHLNRRGQLRRDARRYMGREVRDAVRRIWPGISR